MFSNWVETAMLMAGIVALFGVVGGAIGGQGTEKSHPYPHKIPNESAEHHPQTAQMMIINPRSGSGVGNLFSTHPQTEKRVARLMQMARGA